MAKKSTAQKQIETEIKKQMKEAAKHSYLRGVKPESDKGAKGPVKLTGALPVVNGKIAADEKDIANFVKTAKIIKSEKSAQKNPAKKEFLESVQREVTAKKPVSFIQNAPKSGSAVYMPDLKGGEEKGAKALDLKSPAKKESAGSGKKGDLADGKSGINTETLMFGNAGFLKEGAQQEEEKKPPLKLDLKETLSDETLKYPELLKNGYGEYIIKKPRLKPVLTPEVSEHAKRAAGKYATREEIAELNAEIKDKDRYYTETEIRGKKAREALRDKYAENMARLSKQLPRRIDAETEKFVDKATEKHPLLGGAGVSAMSVGDRAFGGMAATGDTFTQYFKPNERIDMLDPGSLAMARANAIRKRVAEKIDNGFLSGAYQVGMSIVDSVVNTTVWGGLGAGTASGSMAAAAAADGMLSAESRGADDDQIIATGIATGLAEFIFEKYSIENFLKTRDAVSLRSAVGEAIKGNRKNAALIGKEFLKNTAKQSAIEASEEMFTEIANIITDGIIMGQKSEGALRKLAYESQGYSSGEAQKAVIFDNIEQVVAAGIGGAASGGVMSLVGGLTAPMYNTEKMLEEYNFYKKAAKEGMTFDEIKRAEGGSMVYSDDALKKKAYEAGTKEASPEAAKKAKERESAKKAENVKTVEVHQKNASPFQVINDTDSEGEKRIKREYNLFVTAGRNARDFDAFNKATENDNISIGKKARYEAYEAGFNSRSDVEAFYNGENETQIHSRAKKDGTGLVANEYISQLNKNERELLADMGQRLGKKVYVSESVMDSDGKSVEGKITDEAIYISAAGKDKPIWIATHEFGHQMKTLAPESWKAYREKVVEMAKRSGRYDDTIKKLRKAYGNITEAELTEELACDYAEKLFKDPEELSEAIKKDRSLMEKVKDIWFKILGCFNKNARAESNMREAQRTWQEALRRAEEAAGETTDGEVRYKLNRNFEQEYDEWVHSGRKYGTRLIVGETGEALKSIGVLEQNIVWDTGKINKTLEKHKNLDDSTLKQIPRVIEEPIIVMQSKSFDSRLTMFGELNDKNGLPVMVVLELTPKNRRGDLYLDEIKVASTYSKNKQSDPYGTEKTQKMLNESKILYVDANKNRTESWLVTNRLQLPLHITNFGSIERITYSEEYVNGIGLNKDGERYKRAYEEEDGKIYDYTKPFSQQLEDWKAGKIPEYDTLLVGGTPEVMKKIGMNALPITINQRHIDYALNNTKDEAHNIGEALLNQLPEAIKKPVAIVASDTVKGRVVALLEIVHGGKNIIAPIAIDGYGTQNYVSIDSNAIASVFAKDNGVERILNDAIKKEASGQKAVFYIDKNKSAVLLRRAGLQLPGGSFQNNGYIHSIREEGTNVNTSGEKYSDENKADVLLQTAGLQLPGHLFRNNGYIHNIRESGTNVNTKFKNVTETQQFFRWFGNWRKNPKRASKIVNDDGTPKTVYHGINSDFTLFKSDDGTYRFSETYDYAEAMAKERGGSNVMEMYLDMKKPYTAVLEKARFADPEYEKPIIEKARAEGYDGVIFKSGAGSGEAIYAVFKPTQAKSATDNIGTFDKENPDVRYKRAYEEAGEIDFSMFSPEAEKAYKRLEKENKQLRKNLENAHMELLHREGKGIDTDATYEMAQDIKKAYGANIKTGELHREVTKLYDYMSGEKVDWDTAEDFAESIAHSVIDSCYTVKETEYTDLRDRIKSTKITIPESERADFADGYERYRKSAFGKLRLGNDGTALGVFWNSLAEEYPYFFDKEMTGARERLDTLIEIMRETAPTEQSIFETENDKLQAARELKGKLLESFYKTPQGSGKKVFRFYDTRAADTMREMRRSEKAMQEQKEQLGKAMQRQEKQHDKAMQRQEKQHDKAMQRQEKQHDKAMQRQEKQHDKAMQRQEKQHDKAMQRQEKQHDKAMQRQEDMFENELHKAEERSEYYRSSRDRVRIMPKINSNYNYLSSMVTKPTDSRHVPEYMRGDVAKLLSMFNGKVERTGVFRTPEKATATAVKKSQLFEMYQSIMEKYTDKDNGNINSGMFKMYDADLAESLQRMRDSVPQDSEGNFVEFSKMSAAELDTVAKLLATVHHAITSENRAFSDGIKGKISDIGESVIDEMKKTREKRESKKSGSGDYKEGEFFKFVKDELNYNELSPVDFYERIGGTMLKLYNSLRDGFDKLSENRRAMNEVFQRAAEKTDVDKISYKKAEKITAATSAGSVTMTRGQVMSLYALSKREQGQRHIYRGGITVADTGAKGTSSPYAIFRLTVQDVKNITSQLTKEEISVVNDVVRFLSNTCAQWGNETAMKLYGYTKFGEEWYFPVDAEKSVLSTFYGAKGEGNTRTPGFAKRTNKNAANPIEIGDFLTTAISHAEEMAVYNALALPQLDIERVLNYSSYEEAGDAADRQMSANVRNELIRTYGKGAEAYIAKLHEDINGETRRSAEKSTVGDMLMNLSKKAAIGLNIRVALQQPTAIARAGMVVKTKPSDWEVKPTKELTKEMLENSPTAYWKSMGYFEIGVGRGVKDIALGKESVYEKYAMGLYGFLDDKTWTIIWGAMKNKVKRENPQLTVGSKEFFRAVDKEFRYVIDRTQVIDSVLHRTQSMRSKNSFVKAETAFMSEPLKALNLYRTELYKARRDGDNKTVAKVAFKCARNLMVTAIVTGIAQTIADVWRDDKEDEQFNENGKKVTLSEKFFTKLLGNTADNANPINMMPYLGTIYSLVSGYSQYQMEWQNLSGFISSAKGLVNNKNALPARIANFMRYGSAIAGYSYGNLYRDVSGIAQEIYRNIGGSYYASYNLKKWEININNPKNKESFMKFYEMAMENKKTDEAELILLDYMYHTKKGKKPEPSEENREVMTQQRRTGTVFDLPKDSYTEDGEEKKIPADKYADFATDVYDRNMDYGYDLIKDKRYRAAYDKKNETGGYSDEERKKALEKVEKYAYETTLAELIKGYEPKAKWINEVREGKQSLNDAIYESITNARIKKTSRDLEEDIVLDGTDEEIQEDVIANASMYRAIKKHNPNYKAAGIYKHMELYDNTLSHIYTETEYLQIRENYYEYKKSLGKEGKALRKGELMDYVESVAYTNDVRRLLFNVLPHGSAKNPY